LNKAVPFSPAATVAAAAASRFIINKIDSSGSGDAASSSSNPLKRGRKGQQKMGKVLDDIALGVWALRAAEAVTTTFGFR
jgi:hypothetical protein